MPPIQYLTKLHAVTVGEGKGRAYCGPAAISAITGLPAKGRIREVINRFRSRKPTAGIIGVQNREMAWALSVFGYTLVPLSGVTGTLRKFVNDPLHVDKVYLVNVTGHYVVTRGRFVIDNHDPDGSDIDDHYARQKQVQKAWVVMIKPKT